MVNRIGKDCPCSNKEFSSRFSELDIKQVKKANRHLDRNVVRITITMRSIVRIYLLIIFCVSFSRADSGLCLYYLFVWSIFNFLHNFQWITFLTLSYLLFVFCFFGANLRFSHISLSWWQFTGGWATTSQLKSSALF